MTHTAKPIPREERIRDPKLAVLVKRADGVPFEEGLRRADDTARIPVSNKRMDRALIHEWRQVSEGLWCWTGTMTAYAFPGQRLGQKVEWDIGERWVFPVPKEHQDKINAILVAEYPDYSLEIDGRNRVIHVPDDKVGIVLAFPTFNGWYLTDPVHGIPTRKNGDRPIGWRHLQRADFNRVGPVARGHENIFYFGQSIDLETAPCWPKGVVVDAQG